MSIELFRCDEYLFSDNDKEAVYDAISISNAVIMIISNIIGGLGNQMFQYALGRALSLNLGVQLKLDISDFTGYRLHHGFELERVFRGPFLVATDAEVRRILGWRRFHLIRRLLARPVASFLRGKHLIFEPYLGYWPESVQIADDSYLSGYWQSEKYFASFAQVIRDDFTFSAPLQGHNLEVADRIGSCNSVSLHVRRGDYVTDPRTRSVLNTCTLEYYSVAIAKIADRVANPEYFVFSDDISWASTNLRLPGTAYFVGNNVGPNSYIDMRLMSLCNHHIIANSSFSWWGAWLNPRQDKVVVTPKRWFADNRDAKDNCPAEWVRI